MFVNDITRYRHVVYRDDDGVFSLGYPNVSISVGRATATPVHPQGAVFEPVLFWPPQRR